MMIKSDFEQENPPEVNRCASCSTAGDERSTGETIPPPNYRYRRRQNSADDDEQTELLYGKLTELGEVRHFYFVILQAA